jgi:class 3 adenylate cyclase
LLGFEKVPAHLGTPSRRGKPPRPVVPQRVHKGAAIAVTLNERLDYFGQTVNIAARVQDLADADEIFVRQDVYDATGVRDGLAAFASSREQHSFEACSRNCQCFGWGRPLKTR